MNEKQLNVSYEKILRTLINTVVRCVSKGSSESSRIWSVKFGKTNVLDSQQFLHSALLSSEQLETGNKDKDCRWWEQSLSDESNWTSQAEEKEVLPILTQKFFQQWIAVQIIATEAVFQKRYSKKSGQRFYCKIWSKKWVVVKGQDEVQHEFSIPSWRSSNTEHGQSQRNEVSSTKRFEWRQHVSNIERQFSLQLQSCSIYTGTCCFVPLMNGAGVVETV